MRAYLTAVALSALSFAVADKANFTIDINKVSPSERANWCQAQIDTCGILCVSTPKANDCSPSDLTFHCTCRNGTAPGLQYYTQTIDSFVCEEAFTECNDANVGNKAGQDNCTATIKNNCGTLDRDKFQGGSGDSSSTTSSASGTGTAAANPSNTAPSTSSSKAAAPTNAAYFGNGAAVVAAGIFAALL